MNVPIITFKGNQYIRGKEVVKMIRQLGDDEPTDTQERLDELANNIQKAMDATAAAQKAAKQ